MKKNDRALKRTGRDLEKDRRDLERQEKALELEIKKLAKQGNKQALTVLAKQLVNVRKQKTRSYGMGAKVSAVNSQTKAMYSNVKMADAVKTTTKTMGAFNKQMNPQKVAKTMQEFEKANMQMDMGEEMINDTLESILDESGDEAESDAIVNQVLDEIGIEISGKLAEAPAAHKGSIGESSGTRQKNLSDADVERMLQNLRE